MSSKKHAYCNQWVYVLAALMAVLAHIGNSLTVAPCSDRDGVDHLSMTDRVRTMAQRSSRCCSCGAQLILALACCLIFVCCLLVIGVVVYIASACFRMIYARFLHDVNMMSARVLQ